MKKCYNSADILLPDFDKTSAKAWAVVACDQFTSEPEYWESAAAEVGTLPSTLNLILPEVYLSEGDKRIPVINQTMVKYLDDILVCHKDSMIYTERTQSDGSIRRGIVLSIDLDAYDYRKGSSSLIRATEATVIERIPPRVAIRRDACIELPHVMLLIDDPEKTVIEPLISADSSDVAYDTDLMLGGGHIKGRFLSIDEKSSVSAALDTLISPSAMKSRYKKDGLAPLLFAVGDGNHSLASAKAAYEEVKAAIGEEKAKDHPARYALVEIVNIHDDALKFEPIYRVMFGVDGADVMRKLSEYVSALSGDAKPQQVTYIYGDTVGTLEIPFPEKQLTVGTLQDFIDGYLKSHSSAEVDYIHGEESVKNLTKKENSIGFLFSGMTKDALFPTVMFDGALPRKTFSMGHAEDKRYYMECRKIKN